MSSKYNKCMYKNCKEDKRFTPVGKNKPFLVKIEKPIPGIQIMYEKWKRWVTACDNVFLGDISNWKIGKNYYLCSKHFVGGKGPTMCHPDPLPQAWTIKNSSTVKHFRPTTLGCSGCYPEKWPNPPLKLCTIPQNKPKRAPKRPAKAIGTVSRDKDNNASTQCNFDWVPSLEIGLQTSSNPINPLVPKSIQVDFPKVKTRKSSNKKRKTKDDIPPDNNPINPISASVPLSPISAPTPFSQISTPAPLSPISAIPAIPPLLSPVLAPAEVKLISETKEMATETSPETKVPERKSPRIRNLKKEVQSSTTGQQVLKKMTILKRNKKIRNLLLHVEQKQQLEKERQQRTNKYKMKQWREAKMSAQSANASECPVTLLDAGMQTDPVDDDSLHLSSTPSFSQSENIAPDHFVIPLEPNILSTEEFCTLDTDPLLSEDSESDADSIISHVKSEVDDTPLWVSDDENGDVEAISTDQNVQLELNSPFLKTCHSSDTDVLLSNSNHVDSKVNIPVQLYDDQDNEADVISTDRVEPELNTSCMNHKRFLEDKDLNLEVIEQEFPNSIVSSPKQKDQSLNVPLLVTDNILEILSSYVLNDQPVPRSSDPVNGKLEQQSLDSESKNDQLKQKISGSDSMNDQSKLEPSNPGSKNDHLEQNLKHSDSMHGQSQLEPSNPVSKNDQLEQKSSYPSSMNSQSKLDSSNPIGEHSEPQTSDSISYHSKPQSSDPGFKNGQFEQNPGSMNGQSKLYSSDDSEVLDSQKEHRSSDPNSDHSEPHSSDPVSKNNQFEEKSSNPYTMNNKSDSRLQSSKPIDGPSQLQSSKIVVTPSLRQLSPSASPRLLSSAQMQQFLPVLKSILNKKDGLGLTKKPLGRLIPVMINSKHLLPIQTPYNSKHSPPQPANMYGQQCITIHQQVTPCLAAPRPVGQHLVTPCVAIPHLVTPRPVRPVTLYPVASPLVAQSPVTLCPVSPRPVTQRPVTPCPVTLHPVASPLVAHSPVTPRPVTLHPVASPLVVQSPVTQRPVRPVTLHPVSSPPVAPSPVALRSVAQHPITPRPNKPIIINLKNFVPIQPTSTQCSKQSVQVDAECNVVQHEKCIELGSNCYMVQVLQKCPEVDVDFDTIQQEKCTKVDGHFDTIKLEKKCIKVDGDSDSIRLRKKCAQVDGDSDTIQLQKDCTQVAGHYDTIQLQKKCAQVNGDCVTIQLQKKCAQVDSDCDTIQLQHKLAQVDGHCDIIQLQKKCPQEDGDSETVQQEKCVQNDGHGGTIQQPKNCAEMDGNPDTIDQDRCAEIDGHSETFQLQKKCRQVYSDSESFQQEKCIQNDGCGDTIRMQKKFAEVDGDSDIIDLQNKCAQMDDISDTIQEEKCMQVDSHCDTIDLQEKSIPVSGHCDTIPLQEKSGDGDCNTIQLPEKGTQADGQLQENCIQVDSHCDTIQLQEKDIQAGCQSEFKGVQMDGEPSEPLTTGSQTRITLGGGFSKRPCRPILIRLRSQWTQCASLDFRETMDASEQAGVDLTFKNENPAVFFVGIKAPNASKSVQTDVVPETSHSILKEVEKFLVLKFPELLEFSMTTTQNQLECLEVTGIKTLTFITEDVAEIPAKIQFFCDGRMVLRIIFKPPLGETFRNSEDKSLNYKLITKFVEKLARPNILCHGVPAKDVELLPPDAMPKTLLKITTPCLRYQSCFCLVYCSSRMSMARTLSNNSKFACRQCKVILKSIGNQIAALKKCPTGKKAESMAEEAEGQDYMSLQRFPPKRSKQS